MKYANIKVPIIINKIYLILIIATLCFGCHGPIKEENKNYATASSISPGQKYSIDTKETVLKWEGSMVFGLDEAHTGYVYLSKGELRIENDQLVGGEFEIDMRTIEYKDKAEKNSPIQHLKSPDYFDVEKFPISSFVITKVATLGGESIRVTGDLTIKGVTNPISFPAQMEFKDGLVKANGKVVIDRTQWGIRYKSGKFYDNLADETVSDEIDLEMYIVAKK